MKGHKLTLNEVTGNYHCQCYSWHWHKDDADFARAYARHLESEAKREAYLLEQRRNKQPFNFPVWVSKALQITMVMTVFVLVMFTVMHFVD